MSNNQPPTTNQTQDSFSISASLTDVELLRVLIRRREEGMLEPVSDDWDIVMENRDFSDENLSDLDLSRINFSGSTFANADLARTKLEGCHLWFCNFARANLEHTSLGLFADQPTRAYKANFTGANCDEIQAECADFTETDFTDALLTGASFQAASLVKATFERAYCTRATFKLANLWNAKFTSARCAHASFEQITRMKGTDFTGAYLTSASFNYADCTGATLDVEAAKRQHATFTNAKGVPQ